MDHIIVWRQFSASLIRITSVLHLGTDLIDMHTVFIASNRTPFWSKSFCDQIRIPVYLCGIFIFIIIHIICTFHYWNQSIFSKNLHRLFSYFRRHFIVIKSFSIFFNRSTTCADHPCKRNPFKIPRHKCTASARTQPCLMPICNQFLN